MILVYVHFLDFNGNTALPLADPSHWLTPPCEGLIKAGRRYILEGKEAILKVLMGRKGALVDSLP